jgi:hypothetical protein
MRHSGSFGTLRKGNKNFSRETFAENLIWKAREKQEEKY